MLRSNNQLRNADVELQQRAVEYLQLSSVASTDVLATVLEEMPPFPERESSILAKLKKKRPDKKGALEPKDYKVPHINNADLPRSKKTPAQVSINGNVVTLVFTVMPQVNTGLLPISTPIAIVPLMRNITKYIHVLYKYI